MWTRRQVRRFAHALAQSVPGTERKREFRLKNAKSEQKSGGKEEEVKEVFRTPTFRTFTILIAEHVLGTLNGGSTKTCSRSVDLKHFIAVRVALR